MLLCPKCGGENMVSAIFCRSCGKRLNLEELRPEAEMQKDNKNSQTGDMITRVIMVIIAVALLGLGAMIMYPVSCPENVTLDADSYKKLNKVYKNFTEGHGKSNDVSDADATSMLNVLCQLVDTPGSDSEDSENSDDGGESSSDSEKAKKFSGVIKPKRLGVEFLEEEKVRVTLKSGLFGKIPMSSVVVGTISASSDGGASFEVEECYLGKIKLPEKARSVVLKQFAKVLDVSKVNTMKENVTSVTVSDGSISVRTKRVKPPKRSRPRGGGRQQTLRGGGGRRPNFLGGRPRRR